MPIILSISTTLITGNLLPFEPENSVLAYPVDSANNIDSRYVNFGDPINLSNNARDSVYPQIAVYKNNVYVVWEEEAAANTTLTNKGVIVTHENRNYDIYFKKSTDGGVMFGKAFNISNNSGLSVHPQIVVAGSNVYIAWTDDTSFNKDIFFRMSSDEGGSFGRTVKLSDNSGESYNQEISAYANNVYVVWENKYYYYNNTNHIKGTGSTNVANNNINNSSTSHVDDSYGANNNNGRILFKASTDGGNSFKDTKIITTNSGRTAESYPKIAASDNNNVYVAWSVGMPPSTAEHGTRDYDNNSSNKHEAEQKQGIFFTKSSDSGVNFSKIVKLNNDASRVGESQIAASGNQVYITWSGNSDNLIPNDLYFTKSTDNGNSFTKENSLRKNSSLNAELAVNEDNVYIVWQDFLKPSNQEILIKKSIDRGDMFANTITNISNNKGTSECPSIAISKNIVYAIWEDDTLGNHEIFFTKSNNYKLP